jgi:D-serine deaminase-like pyridoxal phosphate-dependent protein
MIPMLASVPTPCLLLDEAVMTRNIARLHARLAGTGVVFRPHLKTAKSVEVARRLMTGPTGPAMVSTLREAEEFAAAGVTDLTYGVGVALAKLDRVAAIRAGGCDLAVILDTVEQAAAIARRGDDIPALIEIDCDGHRSGVAPGDTERLLAIARALPAGGPRGVLTHGGESYVAGGPEALRAAAAGERAAVVRAAAVLRDAGFACPVVSAGSTPTFLAAESFEGLTEFRAGVSVFFDLVQAGIGVCAPEDIAVSVLTEVIGHQPAKGWTVTDAGWMAMSRDRGTAAQAVDQGYGLVRDAGGLPFGDMIVAAANQEHGVLAARPGSTGAAPMPPIGTRLRVLPNHACATAAQYDRYHVIGADGEIAAVWPRFGGW